MVEMVMVKPDSETIESGPNNIIGIVRGKPEQGNRRRVVSSVSPRQFPVSRFRWGDEICEVSHRQSGPHFRFQVNDRKLDGRDRRVLERREWRMTREKWVGRRRGDRRTDPESIQSIQRRTLGTWTRRERLNE